VALHTVYNESILHYTQCTLNLHYTTHSVQWVCTTLHFELSVHIMPLQILLSELLRFLWLSNCVLCGVFYCIAFLFAESIIRGPTPYMYVRSITCLQRSLHIISRVCMYMCVSKTVYSKCIVQYNAEQQTGQFSETNFYYTVMCLASASLDGVLLPYHEHQQWFICREDKEKTWLPL
jgi:hypothetical protein